MSTDSLNNLITLISSQNITFERIIQEIKCGNISDAMSITVFFYIFKIATSNNIMIKFTISHTCTLTISECLAKIGIFKKHLTCWGELFKHNIFKKMYLVVQLRMKSSHFIIYILQNNILIFRKYARKQ